MADSTYEQHREPGDASGSRSPRPVRRSKHYEDLVLKQLRKTSRQFCLETAYACDKHNVNYHCAVEVTHRHIEQDEYSQIDSTKSASHLSEKARVSIRDVQSITEVSAAPDGMAAIVPVQRTRHSLGQELTCSTASPLDPESHVSLVASDLRCDRPSLLEDKPCQTRTARLESPAAASGQTNAAHCAPDRLWSLESRTTMTNSDGMKSGALTRSTRSHGHGTPHSGGFAREDSRNSDASVSVQPSQDVRDDKNNLATVKNRETTNITDDANSYKQTHGNDTCTSVIVQRELHITEVLRHRSFLDDQHKSEMSGSDYHSSDEEFSEELASPKCNEDGSDSGTGIEVYRPDNPSVLRKKIDDLEGQIQDLQEANVATYAEVLRLQQENDALRQQNDGSRAQLSSSARSCGCEQHEKDSSSRSTSRSRLSSNASISSSSSSKPTTTFGSRCSTTQSSKETLCAGQERLQKDENSDVEQREQYSRSMPVPSVADGNTPKYAHEYRSREEAELASATRVAPRTPPYSLQPTRLRFDDDEDGDSSRSRMTASPLGYTVSSGFSHELDVTKLWISSSSDATIGFGTSWSPSTATRALVPRTPADIGLGDAVKYTKRDGRVGRGYVKHVGWCNERKRMCVAVTSSPPEWLQPLSRSPTARCETDEIVAFEKVLLIWKKGMIRD